MMTSITSMSDSEKMKEKAFILFSILMFAQILILIPSATADSISQPTSRTTFFSGEESITIEFDASGSQIQPTSPTLEPALEIPRNSTVEELKFELSTSSAAPSPGQLWLDLNQDGTSEYSFNGTGFGNLSKQTQFSDNSTTQQYYVPSVGVTPGPEIILSNNSIVTNSQLDLEFLAENGGRWIEDSSILNMKTLNLDDDLSEELLLLSENNWNGEPAIGWLNNNSNNNGFTNISWVETCTFGEEIETADFNGDGFDDVLVWTSSEGRFCVHLWDNLANNFTSSTQLLGGTIGEQIFVQVADLEGDDAFEIVYADSAGLYGVHEWRASTGFQDIGSWHFETRSTSGTLVEEGISQFKVGNILQSSTLVFISDSGTIETLVWDSSISSFEYHLPSFAIGSFDTEFIWLEDLNGDTFDEIVTWGLGTQGNVTYSIASLGIYSVASQNGIYMPFGATATDYNQDGVVDILIPEGAPSDGDDLTLEGSLKVYSFSNGLITDTFTSLSPRTAPMYSISGDLNGDLVPELIVYCGEQSLGIFIDSWHKIGYDFEGDGIIELSAEGFAQADSGANSSRSLRFSDTSGEIATTITSNKLQYPTFTDSYNNEMMSIVSELTYNTAGEVSFSNLEITYEWWYELEDLYDGSGHNLSTLVNSQFMEFGSQDFTVPLLFSSSKGGYLNLQDLILVTFPGHPDLPDLNSLTLIATNVLEDSVELQWDEVTTGSQYFDYYELYRSSTENAMFPEDYVNLHITSDYTSVSYTDLAVNAGGHYEYVVKVIFSVGGLESGLSNIISVDLPLIPRVKNVLAVDTPNDQGGSIDVSWDEVDDRYSGYYEVFVRTENFTDTTLLESVALVQSDVTSYTVDYTSPVIDSEGNTLESAVSLTNEEALWVAVVATNESGSNPFVTATGPVYAINNDLKQTYFDRFELSFAEVFGNEMREDELIVGGDQPTVISYRLNYVEYDLDGLEIPNLVVSNAIIMTTLTINPDDEAYKVYFNSTTDDGGDTEVVFNWRDIANDTIGVEGGVVEIKAEYNGRAETLEQGGLAPSSRDYCQDNGKCNDDGYVDIVVPAYFSLLTTVVMVDELGDATLEVSLIAEHDWQQDALTGIEITFRSLDQEGILTGSPVKEVIPSDGYISVYIDAMPEGGYVLIEPDSSINPENPSSTIYLNKFQLNATLVEYDDSGETNLDDDNDFVFNDQDLCPNTPGNEAGEVNPDGCSPSQLEGQIEIESPSLICDGVEQTEDNGIDWSIQNIVNSQNPDLICTLVNPNEVFLELEHPINITVGGVVIGISCDQHYIPSLQNENNNIECKFSPTVVSVSLKESSEPELKAADVFITFTWVTDTSQIETHQYHVDFFLIGDVIAGGNNTGDANTSTDGTEPVINEESTDTKAGILQDPLMLGAIGGGIFSIILVVITIRYFRGDDDDWDDDWDDDEGEELENPLDRILGRGNNAPPVEELNDEPFEREANRGRLSGSAGEEFVKQSQQSNDYEDDPNYSVDEDGTEWWEDEQGQWWYRDPQMDDWEEWNE